MHEPHDIGIVLAVLGFCLWMVSWIGLASYGLAWTSRDRRGATASLLAAAAIFIAGALAMIMTQEIAR